MIYRQQAILLNIGKVISLLRRINMILLQSDAVFWWSKLFGKVKYWGTSYNSAEKKDCHKEYRW